MLNMNHNGFSLARVGHFLSDELGRSQAMDLDMMRLARTEALKREVERAAALPSDAPCASLPSEAMVVGPQGVICDLPRSGIPMRHHALAQQRMMRAPLPYFNQRQAKACSKAAEEAAASRQAAESLLSLSPCNSPAMSAFVDVLATPDLISISGQAPRSSQELITQSHTFWSTQDRRPPLPSGLQDSPRMSAIPWPSPTPTTAQALDCDLSTTPVDSKYPLNERPAPHPCGSPWAQSRPAQKEPAAGFGDGSRLGDGGERPAMGSMLKDSPKPTQAGGVLRRRPSLTSMDLLAGR